MRFTCFNLSREANPLATPVASSRHPSHSRFQSQSRSQSSGDRGACQYAKTTMQVSISVEKPILWRPSRNSHCIIQFTSFNLSREANPLATSSGALLNNFFHKFQSQSRSQSSGDGECLQERAQSYFVSISVEKPIL